MQISNFRSKILVSLQTIGEIRNLTHDIWLVADSLTFVVYYYVATCQYYSRRGTQKN